MKGPYIPKLRVVGRAPISRVHLARRLADSGELEAALRELALALRENPELGPAHLVNGQILAMQGRPEDASECFERAVMLVEESDAAWRSLAHNQLQCGALSQAETSINRAIQLNRKNAFSHVIRGDILRAANRTSDALDAYREAAANDKGLAIAHHQIALLLREEDRVDDAIRHCRIARTIDPFATDTELLLGELLLSQHRLAESLASFRTAMGKRVGDAKPIRQAAAAYIETNMKGAALSTLSLGALTAPDDVGIYIDASRLYASLDRHPEAKAMLEAALEIDPDSIAAQEMLDALDGRAVSEDGTQ